MRRYMLVAAVAAVTMGAKAQDLSKEIEVQHNVVVEHNDARRVLLRPQLVLPAVNATPLQFSDRTVSVAVPRSLTLLEPAAYADTLAVSPWNGYASIGYLPIYNLGINAGYRILDTDRQRLNAWMQFNGSSYKEGRMNNDDRIHRNTLTAGLNYHLMVGRKSELDAGLDYTFSRFNTPATLTAGMATPVLFNQMVNRVNAQMQWTSSAEGLHYTAGINYGYFGFSRGCENALIEDVTVTDPAYYNQITRPVRENNFRFNGGASLSLSDLSSAFLGVGLSVINDTRRSFFNRIPDGNYTYRLEADGDGAFNHALLSLRPRYRLMSEQLTMSIGALVQFTFHSGKVFHIAPDVSVSWSPAGVFTLWGKAGGGEHQNTLGSLFEYNYMMAPMIAYGNSHLPLTLEGGLVVGPRRGAYAELFGGYAAANDWLMPVGYPGAGYTVSFFREIDLKGWHAGVALGYKLRNWVDARVQAEIAPQKFDRAWYQWRDRAKYVVRAEVKSSPIDRLDVGVSYELRCRRMMIDRSTLSTPELIQRNEYMLNLGNISNLGINASYRITPQLSAFINLENLLNRRVCTLALIRDQGIKGLAGVAYKF